MILVDTALRAREEEGRPDPGGDGRRRLHGAGPREPDRQQRARDAPGRSLEPEPRARRARLPLRRAETLSASTTRPVSRTRSGRGSPRSPTIRTSCAAASRSTSSARSPATSSTRHRSSSRRSRHGKDVVLMNAEIDATIGPILQVYAERHGVILSACDGDEPGVQMNLYRWVKGLGLEPRVMGNVKGLQDPYRNPTTQQRLRRAVGPVGVDGDVVRRRLEDLVRAVDRRERHGIHGARARDVTRARVPRGRDGDRLAVRRRPAPRARRRRRLRRRYAADQGLLPCRAHRSEAAALPRALQDGERPALLVLHPVPPRSLRGSVRDRTRVLFRDSRCEAVGRTDGRGVRCREARSRGRGDARPVRHVHDLRGGSCDGRDVGAPVPARRTGRGVHAAARHPEGRGAHLRRRRRARREVGGPPARRAAGAVQGRVVALRPALGFGAADDGRA